MPFWLSPMAAYNPLSMEQCKKLHSPLNLHHIILFYLMYYLEFFSTYLWGVVTSKLSVNSWRARNNPARKFVFFSKHHSVLGTEDLWYSLACLWPHSLSCVWPFGSPWTVACQDPLSMGFLKQEYWSGLPSPPPGDLLNPGIEPMSPVAPALKGGFFTTPTT